MQRRKIIVNNDTYETLEAVRKSFRNEVSDDDILMAAFSALAEKMLIEKRKKEEPIMHDPVIEYRPTGM